jgi:hypothetical protein
LAKLSVSIPDDLKELLDARSESENTPVSHLVADALRAYFAQPSEEQQKEIRQIQEYLWDLYLSYDRTRSAALALHHWADKEGQGQAVLGIPPESTAKKPPWPKPRPRPSST